MGVPPNRCARRVHALEPGDPVVASRDVAPRAQRWCWLSLPCHLKWLKQTGETGKRCNGATPGPSRVHLCTSASVATAESCYREASLLSCDVRPPVVVT